MGYFSLSMSSGFKTWLRIVETKRLREMRPLDFSRLSKVSLSRLMVTFLFSSLNSYHSNYFHSKHKVNIIPTYRILSVKYNRKRNIYAPQKME